MNPFYQGPTEFGFVGSNVGALPTTLDNINPNYYNQIRDFLIQRYPNPNQPPRLASITGVTLYDTLRVDAGVMPTRDFLFYSIPINQQQGLFVAGTAYTKQDIDIHPWVSQGGQLSTGYEALIWSIGVQFHIVGKQDDDLQTSGNARNLTLDPGAYTDAVIGDSAAVANQMRAFQEGLVFRFFINQTDFEIGPGWRFPSGCYGASGWAALCAGATAPAFAVEDGYGNNGFGWSYQMPVMRHLPPLTKFGIKMTVQNPFDTTTTGPVRIVTTLEGIGIQPVTG